MATFAIDILTGKEYLLTGEFGTNTGSTPTMLYSEVNTYSELPDPSVNSGKIYVVRVGSGDYLQTRKESGLYYSTGSLWRRLGDIPSFFKSDYFEVYDGIDNTKGIKFITSGITSGIYRTLEVQDHDGVIAYLSDIDNKLDSNIFNEYTGKTALILVDEVGGVNVNLIEGTAIEWSSEKFSGTSLTYTGGSRIYIEENGLYEISYIINLNSDASNSVNIGSIIRINNNTIINETNSTSFILNSENDLGTLILPSYKVQLNAGDYIELIIFRIGSSGLVYTVENSSWIKIEKK